MVIGLRVGPFFEGCSDEPFRFSIRFWCVGFSGYVFDFPSFQGSGVAFLVADAIVGHNALDGDSVAFVPADGTLSEGERGLGGLIGQDFAVDQP